jgi:YebC/PmpR family DNA-binding regulatory protein
MSGHNKWSKIKHKKAATDAKKSKIFSIHSRLITLASKEAGGDINSPSLKATIERAKADSMPKDNIERAVKKGAGGDAGNLESVMFEAYGPGGVAIIITGITDNTNRTSQEIKHILSKNGGNLGSPGSALWAFNKTNEGYVPQNEVPLSGDDENKFEWLYNELDDQDDVEQVYSTAA